MTKSWDVGYEAGVSGKPMPATPEGGDEESLHHGYAAGEETYLASIRREEEAKQDRPPCWGPAMLIGLAAWAVIAAVGWLVWEVLR